jgi:hypothetical protein
VRLRLRFYSEAQVVVMATIFVASFVAAAVIGSAKVGGPWLALLAPIWIGSGWRLRVLHKRRKEIERLTDEIRG